ncbi:MAG TPA: hypothetical protein VN946_10730 [Terriglobales bacterium]|jgi:hypothetical protein|nr:hypothetical protein [Terriglobales bacterium]
MSTIIDIDKIAIGLADREAVLARQAHDRDVEVARAVAAESEARKVEQQATVQREWLARCQDVSIAKSALDRHLIAGTSVYSGAPEQIALMKRTLSNALTRKEQYRRSYPFLQEPANGNQV